MPGIRLCIKWFKKHHYWLFLLFISTGYAQTAKVDSLQAILKQTIPDTVRLKTLKQLSAAYSSIDPKKKFYYANAIRELAEKLHNEIAVADAYTSMGTACFIQSKYDSALHYFTISYNKAQQIKYEVGIGKSLVNIGFTYDRLEDSKEAIRHYSQALEVFNKLKFQKGIDQCNANIGSIYYDKSQYKTAESYFTQCLVSYTKSNDEVGLSNTYYALGDCAQALGRDGQALDYFNKSMALHQKLGNTNGIGLAHRGLSIVYMHLKQYDKAVDHILAGLKNVTSLQDKYEEAALLKILVEIYVEMKQYDKAEVAAKRNLAISYQLKSKGMASIALRNMILVYQGKKQIAKAFYYQSKYVTTEDSIREERELKDITLTEFSRIRTENAYLSKNNQDINSKNTDYKAKINHYSDVIVITSIVLVFVILLLLMLYRRNLEKQATNKLLTEQKEEIANINHELETLNEEVTTQMELTNTQNAELERLNDVKNKFFSIISHDLRGPLISLQSLFSIYRQGSVNEEELRMLLYQLEDTILSTGAFLDNLLEWSKSQLDGIVINPVNFNINDCINENIHLLQTKIEQKGLVVNNLSWDEIMIHADQNMIRLVIRNLLSNSVKFCNPGNQITFNTEVKYGKALISIHDNGPGISEADREKLFSLEHVVSTGTQGEKGNHLGLILCRDMVIQNKGNIWLDTEASTSGTTFWIELPLAV